MVCNNHVWRLSLFNQRFYNLIDGMQFLFGEADARSGIGKTLRILSVGCFRIVIVLGRYLALITGYRAAITDKRCFAYMTAFLALKPFAYVVTDMAGAAVSIAEDELAAGVRLFAVETVDTKVVGVGEAASVPCIGGPVFPDIVRDSGRILAQELCYFTEGLPLI